jgi:hypothetical protein
MGNCRDQRTAHKITAAGKRQPRHAREGMAAGAPLLPAHRPPLNATDPGRPLEHRAARGDPGVDGRLRGLEQAGQAGAVDDFSADVPLCRGASCGAARRCRCPCGGSEADGFRLLQAKRGRFRRPLIGERWRAAGQQGGAGRGNGSREMASGSCIVVRGPMPGRPRLTGVGKGQLLLIDRAPAEAQPAAGRQRPSGDRRGRGTMPLVAVAVPSGERATALRAVSPLNGPRARHAAGR